VTCHGGGQGSHARLLWNANILQIINISLGKPKDHQVEEDKTLAEDIVSSIYQIMSLIGKYIGGGIGYPTIPSQSKGSSSRLGGREIGESKTLSHSEGGRLGMLMTWLKDASPSTRGSILTRYCIGMTTS
jgi:hypothetical protein